MNSTPFHSGKYFPFFYVFVFWDIVFLCMKFPTSIQHRLFRSFEIFWDQVTCLQIFPQSQQALSYHLPAGYP